MSRALSSVFGTREGKRERRLVIGAVLAAVLLRSWAAWRLPVDFDEPVYLQAALDYAQALRVGDWNGAIDYAENREHPALAKLLFGLAVLPLGQEPDWTAALYAGRALSVVFGTLAVLLLALYDPLAGILLAFQTLAVKYTGQVYLEALPLLAGIGAVLAFQRSIRARDRWFWISAFALGALAASKYAYLPIACAILYLAMLEKRTPWYDLLLYALLAVAAFWLLNPTLWRDPGPRLMDSLFFHRRYAQSAHVQASGYPWFQPFVWIARSMPATWHPGAILVGLDEIIFLSALAGLYWEWRERRWIVAWISTNLLFLLLWPTKWPQYTLVMIPALCLAAASTVRHVLGWIRGHEDEWEQIKTILPRPPRAFWILSGGLVLALVAGYVAHMVDLALARRGWSHVTAQDTALPSDTVYDVLALPGGRMALGTERGAAIWSPPTEAGTADLPGTWEVLTRANSGLPHDRVRAVATDGAGVLWFGTEAGLARYDGEAWRTYRGRDMGLEGDEVHALATGSDGRLWVGTDAGAALYDGERWTPYTAGTSGLVDDFVISLAVAPEGDRACFGTGQGVSCLDATVGEWTSSTPDQGLGWGGVADLTFDAQGRLWVATLGGGLSVWEDGVWRAYRVSNADIPYNSVRAVLEADPGLLWVGTALPNHVGGAVSTLDAERWTNYLVRRSGYSGAEPLAMARDREGRIWIGTRTEGIDIYEPRRPGK